MKTKFFKRLSFVLVVAMVLSLFVPAAGAFAAAGPKLNSTKKYLHLGEEKTNEYNFNISNKQKGWKYFWESANEDVAVVNEKNGVTTATGVGKTKVTVYITDSDDEKVVNLSATVTVRDNIKTVTISNPVEKLAVGEEHDYNRSFVTVANRTDKTGAVTRWTAEPADTSTIDDKGVFVATAAGEYTITARSYQSKARYNNWLKDADKYADEVLATDETKVVVSASIVDVKQVNKTQFIVEFDSSMEDTDLSKDTAKVYQVINGKLYSTGTEMIKSLGLDSTGMNATVELYGNIVSKAEYQFAYGDLTGSFTAANTDLSEIAGLVFNDFQVKTKPDAGKTDNKVDLLGKVNAVNKDGVIIRTGSEINSYLNFEYKGEYAYGWLVGTDAYINSNGYSAKFVATYKNFVYDEATKTYNNVEYVAEAIGTGVDAIVSITTMQYAVAKAQPDNSSSAWATTGFSVPASDTGYQIFTRYRENTDNSWDAYRYKTFTYVSTDHSKLVITGNYLYPAAQGVVTVLVQENGNTVGAFELAIVGSRAYASAELNAYAVSVSNKDLGLDTHSQELVITNKDTMGDGVVPGYGAPKLVRGPEGAGNLDFTITNMPGNNDYGKVKIAVKAPSAKAGTYQYELALTAFNSTKTVNFYVNVLEGTTKNDNSLYTDADVVRWILELNTNNVDLKKVDSAKNIEANVYGYNSNNARIAALNADEFTLDIKRASNNQDIDFLPVSTNGRAQVVAIAQVDSTPVSGPAFEFVALDSYVVTAKVAGTGAGRTDRANAAHIGSISFTVQDTTDTKVILENASVSKNKGTVAEAVKQAFKFQINGSDINEATAILGYKVTKGGSSSGTWLDGDAVIAKGDNIFVEEIYYTTKWADNAPTVKYTIKVRQSFTITD